MRHLTAAALLLLAAGCDRSSNAPRAAPAVASLPASTAPALAADASGTPGSSAPVEPGRSTVPGASGAGKPVGKDDSHWVDVDETDPVLAALHERQAQRDRELLKQDTDEAATGGRTPGPARTDEPPPRYNEQARYDEQQPRYDEAAQDELPPSDELPPDDMGPLDEMPPEDLPPDYGQPPDDYYDDDIRFEDPPPYEVDPYGGAYRR